MELSRKLDVILARQSDCVATIGNFDGLHLGHQAVLKQLRARADALGLPATVIVFEPQPLEFFDPDNAPPRLTRWREKYQLLKEQDVDRMVCVAFNHETAALSAEAFVTDILLNKVGVKHLVIGDDFRFGQGRQGDYDLLCTLGEKHDYKVERSKTFLIENERVSSSRIRKALATDQLEMASGLLGRAYSISGRVAHGDKQGRELGFPTANIELRRMKTVLNGIFIAQVTFGDQSSRPAVAYIGTKPTHGGTRTLLEVHVFDYSGDLYGQYIKVEFLQKLRDDKRFDSFELLKDQIAADAKVARDYFKENSDLLRVSINYFK